MVCYEQSSPSSSVSSAAVRWLMFSVLLLNVGQQSWSAPVDSGAPTLADKRTRMQYNFGLGKRDPASVAAGEPAEFDQQLPMLVPSMVSDRSYPIYLVPVASSDYYDPVMDKRTRPQRFSFGLGKRAKEQMLLEEPAGTSQEDTINNGDLEQLVKRKMQPYSFGLGKRVMMANRKMKKLTNFEDYIKRRYSFGLGKRSV